MAKVVFFFAENRDRGMNSITEWYPRLCPCGVAINTWVDLLQLAGKPVQKNVIPCNQVQYRMFNQNTSEHTQLHCLAHVTLIVQYCTTFECTY